MDETLIDSSVRKRLNMQNEVLNWLEDFSEKMQKRANAATLELHGLLDQAGVVEQDLKNTFNAFRNLSRLQFIENKISEGDEMTEHMKEATKDSVHVDVPAQSYEVDILPRYKEALFLGLSSYKHHLQKANRITSSGSMFKFGSACGPLPHIIGSEEYLHDNSCGLATEDLVLETAHLDFRHTAEPDILHSTAGGSRAMLSADLFEKEPSEKEGIEPMVSAALDFKAMLEAALLSPYKFYDDESSSPPDAVGSQNDNIKDMHAKMGQISSTTSSTIAVAKSQDSQHVTSIEDSSVPDVVGNLTFLQQTDNNAHKLCSALLSESLFDTEEDSLPSNQMQCAQIPASSEESSHYECTEVVDEAKFHGSASCSIQESHVISSRSDKENVHEKSLPKVGDDAEGFSSQYSHLSLHDTETVTALASSDNDDKTKYSKEPSKYDSLIYQVSEQEKSSGSSSATLGDSFKNKKISSSKSIDQSSPLVSKVSFNDSGDEDTYSSEQLSKPVSSLSTIHSESSSMICCTESSPFPRERTSQFKITKPNDMPIREEPIFSTVVSVSPESSSLFSSATCSISCDLDIWSISGEENNISSSAAIEENTKTRESCNTTDLPHEQSQTSEAIEEPSTVIISDGSGSVACNNECLDFGGNMHGEPPLSIEESQ